ncbi:metal-dependent transcriptional regulator [Glutamicibacter sp. JL.03c]|uniref:metal-dependent transcriptional regulator n=1 Tax=Glutamicibacter sp. JL.03c TaxID=2984842 RepID=UPI0021F79204|nr:metal-dependent transcriptional regulator [Glutamicibacter sp. JL.03c]UYQ78653.1 metal-dependent transcriptional regulator [Glutamicibacter sp. JL.03c]
MLTTSEEDYLKALYTLTEWEDTEVSTGALADQLGLSPASVTSMIHKLSGKGLVNHVPRKTVALSPTGRREALRMVRRHRLLETFLRDELGYGWDEVHDEAEALEHTVSDRFIDALDARLGHPRHDPHGDAIPAPDGSLPASQAVRLDRYTGQRAVIDRISDEDPDFLRRAAARGLVPGASIELPHQLDYIEASMIWVRGAGSK